MDYFLAHLDGSRLNTDELWAALSASRVMSDVKDMSEMTPKVRITAIYSDDSGKVDIRVFDEIISLEGVEHSLLNCALWIKDHYTVPLELCHPAADVGIPLQNAASADELSKRMTVWDA